MKHEELAKVLQLPESPGHPLDLKPWMEAFLRKKATIGPGQKILTADQILAIVQVARPPSTQPACGDFGVLAANALLELCKLTPVSTTINEGWEESWAASEANFYEHLEYVVAVLNAMGAANKHRITPPTPSLTPSFYLQLWAILAEWEAKHPPPNPDPCAVLTATRP
jgi:hypothetical protein